MVERLRPAKDVAPHQSGYFALSSEPWLEVADQDGHRFAGCLVELKYSASYWDHPVRPVLRFNTALGMQEHIAPAPVQGSAIWIGRIPKDVESFWISPTNRVGPFAFTVERLKKRRWFSLIARGLVHAPRPARSTVLTRMIGWRPESDNNLAWCVGTTKLSHYARWRAERHRQLDLDGLDRPRFDWAAAEPIHLYMSIASVSRLEATLNALAQQVFPHWLLHLESALELSLPDDSRIKLEKPGSARAPQSGLVGTLRGGDTLPVFALACLAEAAARNPQARIFYGDEELQGADGSCAPVFKPGWSPLLHDQRNFLGRSVFLRVPLEGLDPQDFSAFRTEGKIAGRFLNEACAVKRIARVLLRTQMPLSIEPRVMAAPLSVSKSASIIIPTKDHADQLDRVVRSIRRQSDGAGPELVIVDNGSSEEAAKKLLDSLAAQERIRLVDHPGPFNFSSMCNAGAAVAKGDVLVFLNNDTEILHADWLTRLMGWATQPDIGAVGAKLTFPDGRLQHIGVLLGTGGSAGHFGSFAAADAPGWADKGLAVHEMSAVTGACLAVETRKFWAVQGFDAEAFPVELSDIDLCLRLAERGWKTVVDPFVHLLHEESASRGGATFRRLDVYQDQRRRFIERWRHVIRDDPYFHPALSLFDWSVALG